MTIAPTFSRTSLRQAIGTYVEANIGEVPYLSAVNYYAPKLTPMEEIASVDPMQGQGVGAVVFVKLERSFNRRIASQLKMKTYSVVFDFLLVGMVEESQDVDQCNDEMLDGFELVVLQDSNAGTGYTGDGTGVVWQWGEGSGGGLGSGGTDIQAAVGYPQVDRQSRTRIASRVTVQASQIATY